MIPSDSLQFCGDELTFFLSLMELLPRTMILHPVSASSCLAVSPRGPRILPTKLYWKYRETNGKHMQVSEVLKCALIQ